LAISPARLPPVTTKTLPTKTYGGSPNRVARSARPAAASANPPRPNSRRSS
jgi:hypothetical protein